MTKEEVCAFIEERYGVQAEFPWVRYPRYIVFRHSNNRKWFALLMPIAKEKLGLQQPGEIDVLDLKSTPLLLGSFLGRPGIFPAYHMNKTSWLTAALDGSVDDDTLKMLLEISYDQTAAKPRR